MDYSNLEPIAFFSLLIRETEQRWSLSPISKKYKEPLYYSVCGTSIKRNKGVMFGLNWGGSNKPGDQYEPQQSMPCDISDSDNYRFIHVQLPYLEEFLKISSVDEINYSNLCFFRSSKISDLDEKDWDHSLELFDIFINYVNPEWLIFTSIGTARVAKLFSLSGFRKIQERSFDQGNKMFTAYKGKYQNSIPMYTVPYPYRAGGISEETRYKIWHWLFNDE